MIRKTAKILGRIDEQLGTYGQLLRPIGPVSFVCKKLA